MWLLQWGGGVQCVQMSHLKPFYDDVQKHYDLSDEFYQLFLDPSMTYSCAYFERPEMTLEQAQQAKIDLSLGKCDLKPGQRLLDVGCGWGATALRAAEKYNVRVVGLTLSKHQHARATQRAAAAGAENVEFRLQGWEEFDEPVDRIVSIGALEHFRMERYPAFFDRCRNILPSKGKMLLHSIVAGNAESLQPGQTITHEHVKFWKFIREFIFPGGQVPPRERIIRPADEFGFQVTRVHSLREHYARTLACWAENLQARREQAVALTNQEIYDRYMHYLTGCSEQFTTGHIDVVQFSMQKVD